MAPNTDKFRIDYFESKDRDDFMNTLTKKWKKSKSTAEKYYGAMQKKWQYHKKAVVNKPQKTVEEPIPHMVPNSLKRIQLEDMERMGYKLTREKLSKYGFSEFEINWVEREGRLE